MGTKKKLVLSEKILVLENKQDFDVTMEIIECKSYDARRAEFVPPSCFISTFWVGKIPHSSKCPLNGEGCAA